MEGTPAATVFTASAMSVAFSTPERLPCLLFPSVVVLLSILARGLLFRLFTFTFCSLVVTSEVPLRSCSCCSRFSNLTAPEDGAESFSESTFVLRFSAFELSSCIDSLLSVSGMKISNQNTVGRGDSENTVEQITDRHK